MLLQTIRKTLRSGMKSDSGAILARIVAKLIALQKKKECLSHQNPDCSPKRSTRSIIFLLSADVSFQQRYPSALRYRFVSAPYTRIPSSKMWKPSARSETFFLSVASADFFRLAAAGPSPGLRAFYHDCRLYRREFRIPRYPRDNSITVFRSPLAIQSVYDPPAALGR